MEQKVDLILEGMLELKADVKGLKGDVTELKGEVKNLKEDVTGLKEDVIGLKSGMRLLEVRMDKLESRVGKLEICIHDLKIHLENVTDVNIQRVAEGHLDLYAKLKEATAISERDEMRDIRINVLEGDVKRIKEHLCMCPA